jgi:hypothetical protein
MASLQVCSALEFVMPGSVPGIHVLAAVKTWMAGTSPAMTAVGASRYNDELHLL